MKHFEGKIELNKNRSIRIKDWKTTKRWLSSVSLEEKRTIEVLYFTLFSDDDLLEMNQMVLKHDFYTDVITFDLSDSPKKIIGDIYISYDRVKENAKTFHVKQMDELRRVFVHSLLHLLGYNDKTKNEIKLMREKENYYLAKFEKILKKDLE